MQSQIDRYEVRAELARGGMAAVYHAYDPRFKREVAIKVLPKERALDESFREGFERVAAALDVAHERGIIHRDIEPGNILFDEHGDAFLGDFGLAPMLQSAGEPTDGDLIGTPAYMAPEIIRSSRVTHQADIYALAAVVFEMVGGRPTYEAETPVELMISHVNRPIPDVADLRDSVPTKVSQVIMKGLAKKPEDRYQTAGEMARAFRAAVPQPSATQPLDRAQVETALRRAASRPWRRIPDWRILAGIGGGALVVILVLVALLAPQAEWGSQTPDDSGSPTPPAAPTTSTTPPTPDRPSPSPAPAFVGGGGEFIAFVTNRGGDDDIWLLSVDGGEQVALSDNEGIRDTSPTWSPDGTRIAFVSNRDSGFEIYVMDRDGSNVIRLTELPGDDLYPDWSPDGTQIAFASNRDGGDLDLFVMDADGSNVRQLTHNAYNDLAPAWSPDGTLIAYSSYEAGSADLALVTTSPRPGRRTASGSRLRPTGRTIAGTSSW